MADVREPFILNGKIIGYCLSQEDAKDVLDVFGIPDKYYEVTGNFHCDNYRRPYPRNK